MVTHFCWSFSPISGKSTDFPSISLGLLDQQVDRCGLKRKLSKDDSLLPQAMKRAVSKILSSVHITPSEKMKSQAAIDQSAVCTLLILMGCQ